MLSRLAFRDSMRAYHQASVPCTYLPGISLSLDNFIKTIITTLNEVNNSLTRSDRAGVYYTEDFMSRYYPSHPFLDLDGITNQNYFQLHVGNYFQALPHCLPSEALTAFFDGPTFADCGSVLQACIYQSLHTMIGTDDFNQAFKKNLTPFLITEMLHVPYNKNEPHQNKTYGNPIFFLFDCKSSNKDNDADVNVGDIIYIRGAVNYTKKHPDGASNGWNVICIAKNNKNENLYLGFGPTLFQTPKTYAEIKQRLIDDYNAQPSVYSKTRGGANISPFENDKVDSIIGVRNVISLNLTKAYNFIYNYLPNWHSMTMLQLASNNRHPEPNILSMSSLFASKNMDDHIRLTLRKFAYSIMGNSSVVRGLFLGDVFPAKTNYLLPVLSYLKQQNKKVMELNSSFMGDLKNQNILTGVAWIDRNVVIPAKLLDPKADVFVFDNLDLRQKQTRMLIMKVLGYVLENNAAILVYSQHPIPALSDLMLEHIDYDDWRANNFLVLQTPEDVCKYYKIEPVEPVAANMKP